MINRQTAHPKVGGLTGSQRRGDLYRLGPDRSKAAELLPSNCRSVSSSDPSNPTIGPTLAGLPSREAPYRAYVRPVNSFDPSDLSLSREDESGRRVAIRMCC